ncbi:MAG TPA: peptidoglycan editing factor PgeF [Burkholderiales bacterium]|nr:peptidoglycan editing factor PgeF [Burkholderiales bacterium]
MADLSQHDWIVPDWPAPPSVRSFITTRRGGVSRGPYASMNLGSRVADDTEAVRSNRALLRAHLPEEPRWLRQVHGSDVVEADEVFSEVEADGAYTCSARVVCAVLIADCLPVLLTDRNATAVAVAHAGWRGLARGIIEATVAALRVPAGELLAYLGPGIGPRAFEVGQDVFDAFVSNDPQAARAFVPHDRGKWLCDLFALARRRLGAAGVREVYGGGICTYSDPVRFFSHRRDRITGRMAALIWREPD